MSLASLGIIFYYRKNSVAIWFFLKKKYAVIDFALGRGVFSLNTEYKMDILGNVANLFAHIWVDR